MATNMVYKTGDRIELNVGTGVMSGDPVAVGEITGVALLDADTDGNTVVVRDGVFELSVVGNDGTTGAAVAVGDPLYITAGEKFLDVDATAVLFGYALEEVASGATKTIKVLLK